MTAPPLPPPPPPYHLAQVNIARMRAELDTPEMAGFTRRLDEINALADASPGFVWRFQTAAGDATEVRPFEDTLLLFNMSVWEGLDALKAYVYESRHVELLRAKKQWIAAPTVPHLALWWIARGHIPGMEEGLDKLRGLKDEGPSAEVFTFAKPFPPPPA